METLKKVAAPLLEIRKVIKSFDLSGSFIERLRFEKGRLTQQKTIVNAVNEVSLSIQEGETLCLVGESGCGKSTLARVIIGLLRPDSGEIAFKGQRIDNLPRNQARKYRKRVQMIFQDPYSSLNPKMKIESILEEPIAFHFPSYSKIQKKQKIRKIMDQVGLSEDWLSRFPHEFSGGQRQRIGIARSLMLDPEFLVADEPISALDVSIQAQILNLLIELQNELGLSYLFITHDLSVVRHIGHRVAVMYLGHLCELAETEDLFNSPKHPYTQALLSAIPSFSSSLKDRIRLSAEIPSPVNLKKGCPFVQRCQISQAKCSTETPLLKQYGKRFAACHALDT